MEPETLRKPLVADLSNVWQDADPAWKSGDRADVNPASCGRSRKSGD